MIEHSPEAFGLPESGGFAHADLIFSRVLGVGGFGIVNEVRDSRGNMLALKSMRFVGGEDLLLAESASSRV